MKKLHKRLLKGLGANAFGQVATIIIQLVSVPIFLQAWGVELYGEWLILSTIPSYFAMSDVGFANVAANEMTMEVAKDNKSNALDIFQSVWVFVSIICLILFIIFGLGTWLTPIESWLNLQRQTHVEAFSIIVLFTLHVLVKFQIGMLAAGFRCEGNYALGLLLGNIIRLIENLGVALVALVGGSLIQAALLFFILRLIGMAYMIHRLKAISPWITYGF